MRRRRPRPLSAEDLLHFVKDVYCLGAKEEWIHHVLSTLRQLITADRASYNEVSYHHETPTRITVDTDGPDLVRNLLPVFQAHFSEHPAAHHVRTRSDAARWTDLTLLAEFRKTALYNEYYRPLDTASQLTVALAVTPTLSIPLNLSRSKGNFSDFERAALTLLAPHLKTAYQNALLVTDLHRRLEGMECSVSAQGQGAAELTRGNKVLWATPRVYEWFRTYCEADGSYDALPPPLEAWVRHEDQRLERETGLFESSMPWTKARGRWELAVRLLRKADRRFLLFEERREGCDLAALQRHGLGARESEVLDWVVRGKSNEEIALILNISVKTVKKHLERVFDKLGVDSRTAAATRALALSGQGRGERDQKA